MRKRSSAKSSQTRQNIRQQNLFKPRLIQCGNHLIDPGDVSRISKVKPNLYVVKFKSHPTSEFPCWVRGSDIDALLKEFDIVNLDVNQDDEPEYDDREF